VETLVELGTLDVPAPPAPPLLGATQRPAWHVPPKPSALQSSAVAHCCGSRLKRREQPEPESVFAIIATAAVMPQPDHAVLVPRRKPRHDAAPFCKEQPRKALTVRKDSRGIPQKVEVSAVSLFEESSIRRRVAPMWVAWRTGISMPPGEGEVRIRLGESQRAKRLRMGRACEARAATRVTSLRQGWTVDRWGWSARLPSLSRQSPNRAPSVRRGRPAARETARGRLCNCQLG
jgi:hypothetical protein